MAHVFFTMYYRQHYQESSDHRQNSMRLERRRLRDASNPFELPDWEFKKNFRYL